MGARLKLETYLYEFSTLVRNITTWYFQVSKNNIYKIKMSPNLIINLFIRLCRQLRNQAPIYTKPYSKIEFIVVMSLALVWIGVLINKKNSLTTRLDLPVTSYHYKYSTQVSSPPDRILGHLGFSWWVNFLGLHLFHVFSLPANF